VHRTGRLQRANTENHGTPERHRKRRRKKSAASEVVRGVRGTAVHIGDGTAVHTDYNWDHADWHVVNGRHVFAAVP
jgi:hypothetical protein